MVEVVLGQILRPYCDPDLEKEDDVEYVSIHRQDQGDDNNNNNGSSGVCDGGGRDGGVRSVDPWNSTMETMTCMMAHNPTIIILVSCLGDYVKVTCIPPNLCL